MTNSNFFEQVVVGLWMILNRLRCFAITLLFATLFLTPAAHAENVYRWVDENGEVHFSRTLPPEYANRPYQVLNQDGVVIERIDDPLAKEEPIKKKVKKGLKPLFTEDEVRFRSDRMLLLRYNSEEDLVEAMELEVAQLGYDALMIGQTYESAMKSLAGQVSKVANRQRAGMPAEPELEKNIQSLQLRLQHGTRSLAALTLREEKIRTTFSVLLERYHFLLGGGIAESINEGDAEARSEPVD